MKRQSRYPTTDTQQPTPVTRSGVTAEAIAKAAVHIVKEPAKPKKGPAPTAAITSSRAIASLVAHMTGITEKEYEEGCRQLAQKSEFLALRIWQEVWHASCKSGE